MLSLSEIIVLAVCLGLYVVSFLYGAFRTFVQERRLRQSELAAELELLTQKLCEKQQTESGRV
ncbi:hypothetical protein [Ectobacillus ponti]|uniref:Uncharacterized protein n=1 Tax=Ectobacillus ponti TaxID=2961894 RepID=A0AA41X189_9BACI|nr:hypothetical protein [Ectobacillus ponti]MCP8967109.1 hypothetical protein [Ectobacillus ponti]